MSINLTSYPKVRSGYSKENVISGQQYIVPINFGGGVVIPTPTLVYDDYPDNNFGVQRLYGLGLGVSYKSNGVDLFPGGRYLFDSLAIHRGDKSSRLSGSSRCNEEF